MNQTLIFPSDASDSLEKTLHALRTLRITKVADEYVLQAKIKECLHEYGIGYQKEYRLGSRNRVDFLVTGGIAIEVKQGTTKPNQTRVIHQLLRYASYEEVKAIILVVDRNVHLPSEINGKPCISYGLHKQWGISL